MALAFIKEIFAEYVGFEEPGEVVSDMSISDDLNLDEDALLEIISAIEDEFGIEIPEEDALEFEFIHDIESYVKQAV